MRPFFSIIILQLSLVFPVYSLSAGNPAMKRTTAPDGLRVAYLAAGKGEPALIFLHGGFVDHTHWDHQVSFFAARHRVIAVDLAGHGRSGKDRPVWSLPVLARDILAVIRKEKLRRVILIGNSLGGEIALQTALLEPAAVEAVIAVDTLHDLSQPLPDDYIRDMIARMRTDFPKSVREMVQAVFHPDADSGLRQQLEEKMLKMDPAAAIQVIEGLLGVDLPALARQVKQPIRCLNGDLYPTQTAKNQAIHPDFQSVFFTRCGHYPMLEQPARFNQVLAEVIAELEKVRH